MLTSGAVVVLGDYTSASEKKQINALLCRFFKCCSTVMLVLGLGLALRPINCSLGLVLWHEDLGLRCQGLGLGG